MAQVKFYLEKRKDAAGKPITSDVPVFLFYSYYGKRLQYYTGIRIDQLQWNPEMMAVVKHPDAKRLNATLSRQKRWVEEINEKAQVLGEPLSLEEFRIQLKEKSGVPAEKSSAKSFRALFEEYIEESKLSKKAGTIAGIRTVFKNLKDFSSHTRTALDFNNINQNFYNKLLEYCFNEKKYKNNNTGKIIKTLKSFLNWATERGFNRNMEFKKKAFKKLREDPEIIFLTYEELMGLYNLKLKDERLQKIRDVFCFGCFTGMRYSDIAAMSTENIHADKIVYRITKTNEVNTIPINTYIRRILDKYKKDEKPLPVLPKLKTDAALRDLTQEAKLNRKIKLTHFRGGETITEVFALKDILTFHVSKKTFMTTFLSRGGSLETAMAITGNKDYKTAKRYFKVVDSLKADEMQRVFGK